MRRAAALALLVTAALFAFAFAAQSAGPESVPNWIAWRKDATAPEVRHVAGLTFEMQVRRTEDSATPILQVMAPGMPPLKIDGAEGLPTYVDASFMVLPADLPDHGQVILFRSYTGGAHCCEAYKLIEPTPDGWAVRDAGEWDGEGPEPADVDHDGHLELVAGDMRFDYRLTNHAESLLPPVVLAIRNGALKDISAEPRFVPFYRSKLAEARTACANRHSSIGACLGYVAIAARAGDAAEALKLLDAGPPPVPSPIKIPGQEGLPYLVPEHCGSTLSGSAFSCDHEEPRKSFTDRHAAVVWFLTDLGYLPGPRR